MQERDLSIIKDQNYEIYKENGIITQIHVFATKQYLRNWSWVMYNGKCYPLTHFLHTKATLYDEDSMFTVNVAHLTHVRYMKQPEINFHYLLSNCTNRCMPLTKSGQKVLYDTVGGIKNFHKIIVGGQEHCIIAMFMSKKISLLYTVL